MPTTLTILLVETAEKDGYLDRTIKTMLAWQRDALPRCQVILISQRAKSPAGQKAVECLRAAECDARLVLAKHPMVKGYPMWNVMETAGNVWPRVKGEYVTFHHEEFMYAPGSLAKTLDWLENVKPVIALGNLRRFAAKPGRWGPGGWGDRDDGQAMSTLLSALIDKGHIAAVSEAFDLFPSRHWVSWIAPPGPVDTHWVEDVFYARRDWLDAMHFFDWGKPQLFQDVYDLVGRAMSLLNRHGAAPHCPRMPLAANSMRHLWHPRAWSYYNADVRAWMKKNRKAIANTSFTRDDIWEIALSGRTRGEVRGLAVKGFRDGPGGTITNWHSEFSGWLQSGGADEMLDYMIGRAERAN